MKPHEHAELIHAWADGAEIEYLDSDNCWYDTDSPSWDNARAYRIKRPVDPCAELKAAAADPTKQIRVGSGPWIDSGVYKWSWADPVERYQIRDKPKPKIKMWQWIMKDGGNVFLTGNFYSSTPELRAKSLYPAPWTEIEVEA
jgi:hypothetical protein